MLNPALGAMVSVVTNGFILYVLHQIQSLPNFLQTPILRGYAKTVLHFPVLFYLMTFHLPNMVMMRGMI